MRPIGNRLSLRAVGLALLLATALAVSACGSDGDDAGNASASSGEDEQQVMEVMRDFRTALESADGASACAVMSKGFAAEFEKFGGGVPCEKAFATYAKGDITEDLNPSDLKTTIDGDKATISGYVTHLDQRQTARFVKEDGKWKIRIWFRQRG